jgi:hypothetical protein
MWWNRTEKSRGTREIATIVTYRNNATQCFCQLRFQSGERVLISIAGQPYSSIRISRLSARGYWPVETIWELDSTRLGGLEAMVKAFMAMFPPNPPEVVHPLDVIRDSLLPCGSIQEALLVLRANESQQHATAT